MSKFTRDFLAYFGILVAVCVVTFGFMFFAKIWLVEPPPLTEMPEMPLIWHDVESGELYLWAGEDGARGPSEGSGCWQKLEPQGCVEQ
jgi:hypothetical protein